MLCCFRGLLIAQQNTCWMKHTVYSIRRHSSNILARWKTLITRLQEPHSRVIHRLATQYNMKTYGGLYLGSVEQKLIVASTSYIILGSELTWGSLYHMEEVYIILRGFVLYWGGLYYIEVVCNILRGFILYSSSVYYIDITWSSELTCGGLYLGSAEQKLIFTSTCMYIYIYRYINCNDILTYIYICNHTCLRVWAKNDCL